MANRFSSDFRTRARAGEIPAAVLEFTIDSTTYRFSDQPVASLSQGMFKPQVLDWGGSLVEAADDRNNSIEASAISVTIADHDDTLSNLFFGENRRAVFNSTAKIYLAYSDIAFANWFTAFTGRIATKDLIEPKVWRIGLRFDDTSLAGDTADFTLPVVDEKTFPTAPEDSLGKEIPLIYGKREWDGTGQYGDVQAIYCSTDGDPDSSTNPHRFAVCIGHATNVPNIWANEVAKGSYSKDTDWFWTERNGIYFTEIGYANAPNGYAEPITCNVWGMSTNGNGSTTEADLITNPARQIENFLINFVFNRWRKGAWNTTGKLGATPFDATSITNLEDFFDDAGVIGATVLKSGAAMSILNGWLRQHFCAVWWNEAGKLQFGVRSPYDADVYLDNNTPANWPWFQSPAHGRGDKPIYPLAEDDSRIVERIVMNINLINKDNRYSASKALQDYSRTTLSAEESIDMSWARAEYGTSHNIDAMARRIRRDRFANLQLVINGSTAMLDPDLFDSVLISDPNAPHPSSSGWGNNAKWKPRLMSLVRRTYNLTTKEASCVLEDERFFRSTLFDSGTGEIGQTGAQKTAQGVYNGRASNSWAFTRATSAWVPNLSGNIVKLGNNNTKRTPDGWLFESQSTNWLYNSAFVKGWTNWTLVGSGTSSLDTSVRLFEDETADDLSGTNQTAKLQTDAGPLDVRRRQTTAHSFVASKPVSFSVWHIDSGNPTRIRIQNTTTGNWLTTAGSWSGSEQNASNFSTATDWARDQINFTNDTSDSTLQVDVMSPSGAGNYTNVAHVQIEDFYDGANYGGAFATSVMVSTENSVQTRQRDRMSVANSSSSGRVWRWWEQGTVRLIWSPIFAGGDMASGAENVLISSSIDTPDYMDLLYENSAGTLRFVWGVNRAPGCAINFTVVAGNEYKLVARWIGPNAELGESDGTFKLLMQDVNSGTWYSDDATVTTGVEQASSTLTIGSGAVSPTCDGYIRDLEVPPLVLTDEECKDYP